MFVIEVRARRPLYALLSDAARLDEAIIERCRCTLEHGSLAIVSLYTCCALRPLHDALVLLERERAARLTSCSAQTRPHHQPSFAARLPTSAHTPPALHRCG